MIYTNESDLLDGCTRSVFERHLYRDTDCGAWVKFDAIGITLGSIVEGSDAEVWPVVLRYPFTADDYDAAISAIEDQADELWTAANR